MNEDIELPKKAKEFLKDYAKLCKKHGLMVLSDGEQVQIGPYDEELWNLEESTKHFITRFPNAETEIE